MPGVPRNLLCKEGELLAPHTHAWPPNNFPLRCSPFVLLTLTWICQEYTAQTHATVFLLSNSESKRLSTPAPCSPLLAAWCGGIQVPLPGRRPSHSRVSQWELLFTTQCQEGNILCASFLGLWLSFSSWLALFSSQGSQSSCARSYTCVQGGQVYMCPGRLQCQRSPPTMIPQDKVALGAALA